MGECALDLPSRDCYCPEFDSSVSKGMKVTGSRMTIFLTRTHTVLNVRPSVRLSVCLSLSLSLCVCVCVCVKAVCRKLRKL